MNTVHTVHVNGRVIFFVQPNFSMVIDFLLSVLVEDSYLPIHCFDQLLHEIFSTPMSYAGELSALATAVMWTGARLLLLPQLPALVLCTLMSCGLVIAVVLLFVTIFIFDIQIEVSFCSSDVTLLSGFTGFVFGDTFLFKSYDIMMHESVRYSCHRPAMTALMAFLFLNETLSFTGILGMTITLAV